MTTPAEKLLFAAIIHHPAFNVIGKPHFVHIIRNPFWIPASIHGAGGKTRSACARHAGGMSARLPQQQTPCGGAFWWERANPATKGIRYEVAPVGEVVLDNDACWFNVGSLSHFTPFACLTTNRRAWDWTGYPKVPKTNG